MAKTKRVRKSYASSPSFAKLYGKAQKAPRKMGRKRVFVKG
jgi:hypothetical protein